jgi:hypothetical protein
MGVIASALLKAELGGELDSRKEDNIMGLYLEVSQARVGDMELEVIEQLKRILPRLMQQTALMVGFRTVRTLGDNQSKNAIGSLLELQEIAIKDCLFRITDPNNLGIILEGINIKTSEKNEEYRLINSLWGIADHFRKLTPATLPPPFPDLWDALFGHFSTICHNTHSF